MYILPPEASEAEFRELLAYWQSKAPPGALPGRQHIDPTELPPRHLAHLLLLDVLDGGKGVRRYRFRVAGTAFSTIAGRDVTGLYCDEIGPPDRIAPVLRGLDLTVARKAPVFMASPLSLPSDDHFWVKRLGLPLAQDGQKVDMVLGVWLAERRSPAELALSDPDAGAPRVLELR